MKSTVLLEVLFWTGNSADRKTRRREKHIYEPADCGSFGTGIQNLRVQRELTDYHFKRWLDFQAAGPDNIVSNKDQFGEETYLLTNEVIDKLNSLVSRKSLSL